MRIPQRVKCPLLPIHENFIPPSLWCRRLGCSLRPLVPI
nr:MAG TPA: hypothetical protein [Caudoviricetes sp.]DAM90038.1 MAG TPA: hypothetical protein [Caudoviricetes sp.]